ncbi:unnamed protein product [Angiostrongylus costaricensis]|uniref:TPR_REGION domain-containing protein n=1 Tax=Angiostrongylus costaricensis TaxID=334426 RepID=A0A0R3PWW0_ANGCS|nr:unnamed protein product [Angiostrongylus costaricensis]
MDSDGEKLGPNSNNERAPSGRVMPPNTIEHLIALLKEYLSCSIFRWSGKYYAQIRGLAMGQRLAPSLAIAFMSKVEAPVTDLGPLLYCRFAHIYLGQWVKAANYAKRLVNESKWSKCIYTYLLCILIAADTTYDDAKRMGTVTALARKVDGLRHRIAGKPIPVEKYCARKANRFIAKQTLMFAHYWNPVMWSTVRLMNPHSPGDLYIDGSQSIPNGCEDPHREEGGLWAID